MEIPEPWYLWWLLLQAWYDISTMIIIELLANSRQSRVLGSHQRMAGGVGGGGVIGGIPP